MYNNHDDKIKAKEEFKFRNFIAIRSMFIYISDGHTYACPFFFIFFLKGEERVRKALSSSPAICKH